MSSVPHQNKIIQIMPGGTNVWGLDDQGNVWHLKYDGTGDNAWEFIVASPMRNDI